MNPTHIIAEHLRQIEDGLGNQWPINPEEIAAIVVSKLMDASYSIVPNVVLAELVDPDKCSFDHNGGCQAHGHFPPDDQAWTCPVEDAKNILAAATEGEKP